MLAIAVLARREPPHGDGQHRRYVQRGSRRAVWHLKIGGTLKSPPARQNGCIMVCFGKSTQASLMITLQSREVR